MAMVPMQAGKEMSDRNEMRLEGNVSFDPDVKEGANWSYIKLNIATNTQEGGRETKAFHKLKVWQDNPVFGVAKGVRKGDRVRMIGYGKPNSFEGRDGKVTVYEFCPRTLENLSGGNSNAADDEIPF